MIDIPKLRDITKTMSVLYVEDDVKISLGVSEYLKKFFSHVDTVENGQLGLEKYQSRDYNLVLSDILMPIMNGLEMCTKIRELNKDQEIIIISAYSSNDYFIESIKIGVSGYILKPMDFNQMNEALYRSAIKINALKEVEDYKLNLIEKVEERTAELSQSIENERQLQYEQIDNYEKTIFSFIDMIERRDSYTAGHSERVAKYAKILAKEMGYEPSECENLYRAALLHDIGKVVIPDSVLLKPGKLNDLEYKLIQEHVNTGYNILNKIPMYKELAEIVRYHHEKYDGSGYPFGLKGNEIPFLSQILTLADSFDAMTTNRIYKSRKDIEHSLEEIKKLKSVQFHPDIVDTALEILKDIKLAENINQLPKNELEETKFAYFFKDQLTDAHNMNYLEVILLKNREIKLYNYLYVLDIKNFTQYNNHNSWEAGNKLLINISKYLKTTYSNTLTFRIHGDDFLILSDTQLSIDKKILIDKLALQESGLIFTVKEYNVDTFNANSDLYNLLR